jgi:chemotaxis signal transduction protein
MTAQNPREILEARARQLARRAERDTRALGVDMLVFSLGRERFAVPSSYVFAVFPLSELVPLPGATPPVVGLTRWRGDVLTVLDLRRLVGTVPTALDDLSRVIVMGTSSPEFGVLADAVSDIVAVDPSTLHALPEARGDSRVLAGITRDAVHVIDAAALIARQADVHSSSDALVSPPSTSTQ